MIPNIAGSNHPFRPYSCSRTHTPLAAAADDILLPTREGVACSPGRVEEVGFFEVVPAMAVRAVEVAHFAEHDDISLDSEGSIKGEDSEPGCGAVQRDCAGW